jgi:hypothetical protein
MADIDKLSKQIIDYAERLADVADAAKGKGNRQKSGIRWVLLPAAGAGLYALATNGSFAKRTKGAMEQAKARASELPEDLINRVRQSSPTTEGAGNSSTRQTSSARRTGGRRSRSTRSKSASSR